jgi:peptidoglycan/LPS O-acetylase OafA/YrhL
MAFNWGPTEYMGHTWSLATEEQFYWIWPLTLLFIAKRRPMLWIGAAAMVLLFDRAFLWMDGASFGHLQFGPDSRPIGLLVGCALALIPERRWPIMPTSAPFLLLTILAIMCVSYQGDMHWQMILMPPIVSLAAAGLIVSARLGSPIAKLLALPAVVYVGRISYGLYLYTGPITFLGQRWVVRDAFHLYTIALIALSFLAAALSYEFVEKPFLRLKDRFQGRTTSIIPVGSGLAARS